jgi:hypothetical protein
LDSSGVERGPPGSGTAWQGLQRTPAAPGCRRQTCFIELARTGTLSMICAPLPIGLRSALAVTGGCGPGIWLVMAERRRCMVHGSGELHEDHRTVTFEAGSQLDPRQPSIASALATQVHKCRISGVKRTPRRLVTSEPAGRASVFRPASPALAEMLTAAETVLVATGNAVALRPDYGMNACGGEPS